MATSSFVGYVGDPDCHDGRVLALEQRGGELRVRVRGYSEREFDVVFEGVQSVRERSAEGMMLYALSEWTADPPIRRFVFNNWDDDDDGYLEIEALSFAVLEA